MAERQPEPDRTAAGGAAPGAPDSPSVLPAIEARAGVVSRLLLRNPAPTEAVPGVSARSAPPAAPQGRGRYELHGEIGRGGMGVVLRGRDRDLGRDVALKVLDERLAGRPEVVQRFVEEAQIGGQLQHPGIVPVYELGLMADERPYFSMKLVKGRTLASLLEARPASPGEARRLVDIFASVCQTLAYAHSRGVIHRDVKPANVMVGAFGEVQLVDWGLAKVLHTGVAADEGRVRPAPDQSTIETVRSGPDSDGSRSQAGSVMGTPAYMSPEQARGEVERVDERSDVFSLGAILCEILSGKPPYTGRPSEILDAAAAGRVAGARARLAESGAEAGLVAIANACLAASPEERPAHAGVVAQRVLEHLASVEERSRQAQVEAAEARVKAASERRARRLTLALASSVVATLLLVGGGWAWLSRRAAQRERDSEAAIGAALAEATAERGQGRFAEALGAAERARGLAGSGDVGTDVAQRLTAEIAAIEDGIRAAQAHEQLLRDNAALLAELADLSEPQGDATYPTDWAHLDREYAAVFARHGIDLDGTSPGAAPSRADELAARGISVELAALLDEWAAARFAQGDTAGLQRILALTHALDPDRLRTQLRNASRGPGGLSPLDVVAHEDVASLPVSTQNLLGTQLAWHGELDASAAVLCQASRLHPDDFESAMNTGRILRLVRPIRLQEAARAYNAALALRPESAAAANELAVTLKHLGELGTGIEVLEAACDRHPADAHLRGQLADLHFDAGHHEQALASAQQALALDPDEGHALVIETGELLDRGELAGAFAAGQRAVASVPGNGAAHHNLARVLVAQGNIDGAIAEYRRSIELEPNRPGSHNNLGNLLYGRGDYAAAIALERRAVELSPDDSKPVASLAWYLATCPDTSLRNCEDALTWARRGVEQAPGDANALNNLGAAFFCAGRWSEAIEALTQSLAHCADTAADRYLAAVDHCLLATAEARSGRSEDARRELALAEGWVAASPRRVRGADFGQMLDEARAAVVAAEPASHQP